MSKLRIGFFGGCFNPPTIAHIELAKLAIKHVNLDKLIFVPMGNCYPKVNLIDFKYRYEMLKIAIRNQEKMEISEIQQNQESITYAVDSFEKIDKIYNGEKYFIMGEDNFNKIESWKSSEKLKKYNFIVFERNENSNKKENIIFIETKNFNNISSTRNKRKNQKQ